MHFQAGRLMRPIAVLAFAALVLVFWGDIILSALRILFGACLIAFLFLPISQLLEKKMERRTACLLGLASVILVLGGLIAVMLPLVIRQISDVIELLPEAFRRIQGALAGISRGIEQHLPGIQLPDMAAGGISGIAKQTFSYAGSLAGGAYQFVLMVILAYFLMAEREKVLLRAELLVPGRWRRLAVRMGNHLLREMRMYLRGQATIALAVGILATAALVIIGVRAAPLLGLVVGVFNVIPYFGPFIGGIPAVVMALSAGWQRAGLTIAALFLVQQIDGLILSPRIMGSITGFSPGIVLLGIYLGQQAFGIWGMLMAMPVLMGTRTVYRVFVQRHENN